MSQHVEIVSEPSPIYFLAQCSDKGPSIQHLRPNIEPIYHQLRRSTRLRLAFLVNWVNIRTNRTQGSDFGLKTWTRRISFASDRFGSGSFKAMNGNLYCIFSTKE